MDQGSSGLKTACKEGRSGILGAEVLDVRGLL